MSIENDLKQKLSGYKKLILIGLGSELRGDDQAGLYICKELRKTQEPVAPPSLFELRRASRSHDNKIMILIGGTTPENLTGQIKREKPTHILLIDAFESEDIKDDIMLIDASDAQGINFSTHSFPVGVLADYLKHETGCKVLLLGIKANDCSFKEEISEKTKITSDLAVKIVKNFLF